MAAYEIIIENWSHEDDETTYARYRIPEYMRGLPPNELAGMAQGTLTKTEFGEVRLFRIRNAETGEKGGRIESLRNLSQSGKCWIHPDAIVCGDATVCGDAQVKGGEIGGKVFVGGSAEISGDSVIKGQSQIFGKVKDSQVLPTYGYDEDSAEAIFNPFTMLKGEQTKEGTAGGAEGQSAESKEDPADVCSVIVGPSGEVTGDSVILGKAKIYGKVDDSVVSGRAVVYGEVKGGSIVTGKSVVFGDGVVDGGQVVLDGEVGTRVEVEE